MKPSPTISIIKLNQVPQEISYVLETVISVMILWNTKSEDKYYESIAFKFKGKIDCITCS